MLQTVLMGPLSSGFLIFFPSSTVTCASLSTAAGEEEEEGRREDWRCGPSPRIGRSSSPPSRGSRWSAGCLQVSSACISLRSRWRLGRYPSHEEATGGGDSLLVAIRSPWVVLYSAMTLVRSQLRPRTGLTSNQLDTLAPPVLEQLDPYHLVHIPHRAAQLMARDVRLEVKRISSCRSVRNRQGIWLA